MYFQPSSFFIEGLDEKLVIFIARTVKAYTILYGIFKVKRKRPMKSWKKEENITNILAIMEALVLLFCVSVI